VTEAELSDDHLLAAARAGDRRALETLLERHQAQVYRFGMRMWHGITSPLIAARQRIPLSQAIVPF